MFCLEVIAHGTKTAPAMPAPGMRGSDPGEVLPQAQVPESAPSSLGGVPQLVQPAHLDGRSAPSTAPAGAVLPRVCRAVSARRSQTPHPGHGGGSHRPSPRRLGQVHRPGQPPEPVQDLPRPQDGQRTGRRTAKKSRGILNRLTATGRNAWARARGGGCARADAGRPKASNPPPTLEKFRGGGRKTVCSYPYERFSPRGTKGM